MKSVPPTAGDRICIPKKGDAQELRFHEKELPVSHRQQTQNGMVSPVVHKRGKLEKYSSFWGKNQPQFLTGAGNSSQG